MAETEAVRLPQVAEEAAQQQAAVEALLRAVAVVVVRLPVVAAVVDAKARRCLFSKRFIALLTAR